MTYTQATGKRPKKIAPGAWRWFDMWPPPDDEQPDMDELPSEVFSRLVLPNGLHDWIFKSRPAALAAADAAYERAVAEGAMGRIEGVKA